MFYVTTAAGFLIYHSRTNHYDVHPDRRRATGFDSFADADHHGRTGVGLLLGRVNQYWDIMTSVSLIGAAHAQYAKECATATNV